jgi:thimet oligopeptidase
MLYDYTNSSVGSVTEETDAAIARADALVAEAVTASPSFEGTLLPLELAGAELVRAYGRGAFMGQVHTDSAVRDAGNEAEERLNKWRVAVVFRRDLFEAVRAFAATEEADQLTGESRRLLDFWLRDFRRAGHELPAEDRAELERLRTRLVEVEVAFQRNVNEYKDGIDVTREELAGLPESYIERLSPGESPGTYRVSLDYPELNPFIDQAQDRERRQELYTKFWNQAVDENRPLLDEALDLRKRIAGMLGQPTWAHYAMELKMAGAPERVRTFYEELLPSLGATVQGELDRLEGLLTADGQDGPITAWDWRYYDDVLRRTEYGVDQDAVSEYLPLDPTMEGMFSITGEVFGLEYRVLPEAHAWHESVRLYEILDKAGHRGADGEYVAPVSVIVANFTPPSGARPSLLRHSEVSTLFHEFGHILHMSLTRAEFARFSGSETEWDFVEAPSQIMEHWAWTPSVLERFARHHETGEPMPADLMEQMARARFVNVGLRTAIQAYYGLIDLAIHAEPVTPDLDAAMRRTFQVTGLPYPEGTFFLSGFGHLLAGYDAGYYGYLWANVIGDDMFSRFSSESVLSPVVGADYRREILEPNGSRDADDLVRAFLGREPSNAEFLRLRGMA